MIRVIKNEISEVRSIVMETVGHVLIRRSGIPDDYEQVPDPKTMPWEYNYICENCNARISTTVPMEGTICFHCHRYSLKPDTEQ